MQQNNQQNVSIPKSKFNLIFRTTYFSKSQKIRKIYSTILYLVAILLFVFLILSLMMTYSFNLTSNNFVKDFSTNELKSIFGSVESYNTWSTSTLINGTFGSVTGIGGNISLGDMLGISGIIQATTILSFISVALILVTVIFKKQTIVSYISLSISSIFLIILIALFSILVIKDEGNTLKFMDIGNELKSAGDTGKLNAALAKMKQFMDGLNK